LNNLNNEESAWFLDWCIPLVNKRCSV